MLFEDQTKGQEGNQTQQNSNQEDWLSKIVEAKGESFKDPQVLAKSKLESDKYITELERQIKELREDLNKEETSKKLLEELQSRRQNPTNANSVPTTGGPNPSNTQPEISEDVIKRLVEQTLTARENQNTAAQNTKIVQEQLLERYGTEAKTFVENKAKELGITMERLSGLASESPTAFMTLLGESKPEPKPIVSGTINTSSTSFTTPTERNWAYYQKLRRENKPLYFSPQTQKQMMSDKMRLGDKFGNS